MRLKSPYTPKKRKEASEVVTDLSQSQNRWYEGERLDSLLQSIKREIELEKKLNQVLPEKIWLKQHFAIGVNEVTRGLERMAPCQESGRTTCMENGGSRGSSIQLQAIILACDCNPRWLTKHIPALAESRKVPLIVVKDGKRGSLRLGEVVNLKTTITLGVKARGTSINWLIEEMLIFDYTSLQ